MELVSGEDRTSPGGRCFPVMKRRILRARRLTTRPLNDQSLVFFEYLKSRWKSLSSRQTHSTKRATWAILPLEKSCRWKNLITTKFPWHVCPVLACSSEKVRRTTGCECQCTRSGCHFVREHVHLQMPDEPSRHLVAAVVAPSSVQ